jgi:hypothetical protein
MISWFTQVCLWVSLLSQVHPFAIQTSDYYQQYDEIDEITYSFRCSFRDRIFDFDIRGSSIRVFSIARPLKYNVNLRVQFGIYIALLRSHDQPWLVDKILLVDRPLLSVDYSQLRHQKMPTVGVV